MDRFHILLHLTDYGKDYINRTVKAAEPIESEEITQEDIPHFETTYDKLMAAKALKKQDKTYVEISNELFVSEMTARKYVNISEEEAEKYKRKTALQRSEESANAKEKMFNEIHLLLFSKKSELLESWLDTAEASGIPELKSFANGIRQDPEATKAGIKYSYSNGIAEGNVNKIKMIKRRMYGRCSFELLRAAVLLNQNG